MEKARKKKLVTDDGQQMFFEPEWFDKAAWLNVKRAIQDTLRQLDRDLGTASKAQAHWSDWHGKLNWEIGDWVLGGKRGGVKVRELKGHVKDVVKGRKLASGTISNIMSVCNAVESSRRREDVPFSMHVLVAPFEPAKQVRLLELAARKLEFNEKYSVRDFKKAIAGDTHEEDWEFERQMSIKQDRKQPLTAEEQHRLTVLEKNRKGVKDFEKVTITLAKADFDMLQPFAEAKFRQKGRSLAKLLNWMASEYFKAHRPELDDLVKAHKAETEAYWKERREFEAKAKAKADQERRESLTPAGRAVEDAKEASMEAFRDARAAGKSRDEAIAIAERVRKETYASSLEKYSSVALAEA